MKNLVENLDCETKINKLKAHKKTLQERITILNGLDEETLSTLPLCQRITAILWKMRF